MKKIILILATTLLAFGMNAQQLDINKIDEFEGHLIRSTKAYQIGKKWTYSNSDVYITADVSRVNNYYFITLKSSIDLGCAGVDDNYVIFKFTDGTILKLTDDGDKIDCADRASSCFRIDPNGPLRTKTIAQIKFRQSETYQTFEATEKRKNNYTVGELIERVETATLPTEAELKKAEKRGKIIGRVLVWGTVAIATWIGIVTR